MHHGFNNYIDIDKELLIALCNSVAEATAIAAAPDSTLLFCNTAWVQMFEVDRCVPFEVVDLDELRLHKLPPAERERRKMVIDATGSYTEQAEYVTHTGRSFWAELTLRPFDHQQQLYYFIIIERIDGVKKREQRIEDDSQRFDALLDHASMGIIETDNEARIVNINRFALQLFGYTLPEVVGKPIELLIPARYREKHIARRSRYADHPKSRPMGVGMDLYAVKRDGTEFPVEVSLSHYFLDHAQYFIAFISDITMRKQSEQQVKRFHDQLEATVDSRTKQLQAAIRELDSSRQNLRESLDKERELSELKSRFVSMASHEFRTPLSTVLSSAYLLEQYNTGEDQPKRERHLKRIVSAVKMLTDILNDFLSVGKIEEGKIHVSLAPFDIEKVTESISEELKENLKTGQEIKYTHEGDRIAILDESLYKHILMNLTTNASKFSPEHSLIHIHSSCHEGTCVLTVKDQGIGISQEDQRHLKERFFRGTNAVNIQGTGLGLHLVSKYAELMNARLECRSELGEGSEFTISFYSKAHTHEKDSGH